MHDLAPGKPSEDVTTGETDRPGGAIVGVAVVAILIGLVLRFVTRSALWLDEALSVNIAELGVPDLLEALRHDGHPPLYYLLLHGWIELFGTGDAAVRSLSGLFGVLTLPVAWYYGRRRGGAVLGWLLVGIVALSPFALRYATETRMYSLVILLVFVGAVLLDDILVRGRDGWGRVTALALTAAALLYTHYWAMWLLAAVGLLLLWRCWRDRGSGSTRPSVRVLIALVGAGVLFLPWVPTLLYQSAHTGTPWASPSRPTTILAYTLSDFSAGGFPDAPFIGAVVAAAVLLGIFGKGVNSTTIRLDLRTRRHYRPEALVLVVTMALGTLFIYATWSAFATRYVAVIFPMFTVLVAAGVTRFVSHRVRLGVFVLLLGLLSIGAVWNVRDQRTQARSIGDAIAAEAEPGDLVIYCPDQLGPSGSRALGDQVDQVTYPAFGDPERVDWVDYAERNAAADPQMFADEALARAGEGAIFVVWNGSYRTFEGQCEALVNAIAEARPTVELVADGGATYFEHATVNWAPRG